MTEEQIRAIAQATGFTILESPVWTGVTKLFIEELLRQINQEKQDV